MHQILEVQVCSTLFFCLLIIIETLQLFYYSIHTGIKHLFHTKALEYIQIAVRYFHVDSHDLDRLCADAVQRSSLHRTDGHRTGLPLPAVRLVDLRDGQHQGFEAQDFDHGQLHAEDSESAHHPVLDGLPNAAISNFHHSDPLQQVVAVQPIEGLLRRQTLNLLRDRNHRSDHILPAAGGLRDALLRHQPLLASAVRRRAEQNPVR